MSLATCFNVQQDDTVAQDSGYVAYRVEKSSKSGTSTVITVATIASTVLPIFMGFAGGFLVAGALGMFAFTLATKDGWNDPVADYKKIWGKVEKQIDANINSKAVAVMSDQLRTLSDNINDLSKSYMASLGVSSLSVPLCWFVNQSWHC